MSQTKIWRNSGSRFPSVSLVILIVVSVLTLLGILVLYSASKAMYAAPSSIVQKQLIWFALSLLCAGFVYRLNLEWIRQYSVLLGAFSLFLLFIVLIPGIGVEVNGARRWIDFGFMRLQVSEIGKIGLLFALSHYLAVNRRVLNDWVGGFILPFFILGLFCTLIFLEPDFGTAFLCGLVGVLLFFVSGMPFRFLFPTSLLALLTFIIAIINNPERMSRITSFLDVEANRSDSGYQLWQGILAFGVGGIEGVGLGSGRQQMSFLPEAHTDFIFAIVGEELGLFFTLGVVFLFVILFFCVLSQLKYAPNLYQCLLVLGAILFIEFQALINIGVVTGCLPTKGMSLPFISYGGSNLLFMFVLIALILNCFSSWQETTISEVREL
jgi:cell division protein FtsW